VSAGACSHVALLQGRLSRHFSFAFLAHVCRERLVSREDAGRPRQSDDVCVLMHQWHCSVYFSSGHCTEQILTRRVCAPLTGPLSLSLTMSLLSLSLSPSLSCVLLTGSFIFMAFMILCSLASTSMALLVSAVCRTTDLSVSGMHALMRQL
jgi:hypothetical protein